MNPTRRIFALTALATITVAGSAGAATFTWNGSSNYNWNTGGNWTGGLPASANTTDLVISGSTRIDAMVNNLANGFALRSLTFSSGLTGAAVVTNQTAGNNRLAFADDDISADPIPAISQESAFDATLNSLITVNVSSSLRVNGSGDGILYLGNATTANTIGGPGGTTARELRFEGSVTTVVYSGLVNKNGSSSNSAPLSIVINKSSSDDVVRLATSSNTTNSYSGTTAVDEGILLVNSSHTGGGNYTVAGGGTLGGTGTITPAASKSITLAGDSLSSRAVLAPGDAVIESLQIGSSTTATTLDLGAFSTLAIDLDASTADVIDMFGTVNLNDTQLALTITGSPAVNQLYTIINNDGVSDGYTKAGAYSGLFTYGGSQLGEGDEFVASGTTFKISYVGNDGNDVTLSVVPEPSALAVLSLAGLALGRRRRAM
jgi:hypothetical protein